MGDTEADDTFNSARQTSALSHLSYNCSPVRSNTSEQLKEGMDNKLQDAFIV